MKTLHIRFNYSLDRLKEFQERFNLFGEFNPQKVSQLACQSAIDRRLFSSFKPHQQEAEQYRIGRGGKRERERKMAGRVFTIVCQKVWPEQKAGP